MKMIDRRRRHECDFPSAQFMTLGLIVALASGMQAVCVCAAGVGQDEEPSTAAADLLAQVAQAYQEKTAFYEKTRILAPVALQAVTKSKHMRLKFWFRRPNLLKVESPQYDIVSDGIELMVHIKKLNQYMITKAPEQFDQSWFNQQPFAKLQLPYTLLLLTDAQNCVEQISRDAERRPTLDRKIKKAPCLAVELPKLKAVPQLDEARIFIDQQTHLVRRVTIKDPASKEGGWMTWIDVLKIDADASVDESSFVITPPKRAKLVRSFQWQSR